MLLRVAKRFCSPRGIALGIFLLALVLRWDFAITEHPPALYLVGDMDIYLKRGQALFSATPTAWDTFTPIGYPAMLAVLHKIAPGSTALIGAAQVVLGALVAVFTFFLALRLRPSLLVASLAGVAVALYFPLIFYTGLVLTETFFSFLLLGFVLCALRALEQARRRWALLAGGLLAGAILVRPSLLALLPFLAALAVPRAIVRVVLAAALVGMVPVIARNSALLGRPALVASNGGVNFFLAFSECASVRSRARGEIALVSTHYNRTHFSQACEEDAPFFEEGAYYRAGLAEIRAHPLRLLRALDGIVEGLGLTRKRPWPHQPFWPGSLLHEGPLWGFSLSYFWAWFLPALGHLGGTRSSRPSERDARFLGWAILASVLVVLYAYNGNPRVRVSSDPVAIALGVCAWGAAGRWLWERVKARR